MMDIYYFDNLRAIVVNIFLQLITNMKLLLFHHEFQMSNDVEFMSFGYANITQPSYIDSNKGLDNYCLF
jgi:hypothetical protein